MIVMVTGGRNYTNKDLVWSALDASHRREFIGSLERHPGPITELIHGACGWDADDPRTWTYERLQGADGLADLWAREHRVRVTRVPAHWKTCRNAAGQRRNGWMLDLAPDLVIAFPGGAGTAGAVRQARERGFRLQHVSEGDEVMIQIDEKLIEEYRAAVTKEEAARADYENSRLRHEEARSAKITAYRTMCKFVNEALGFEFYG